MILYTFIHWFVKYMQYYCFITALCLIMYLLKISSGHLNISFTKICTNILFKSCISCPKSNKITCLTEVVIIHA